VTERVRARATWGKVELHADDPVRIDTRPEALRLDPLEKRATEAAFDRVTRHYGSDTVLRELSWTFAAERLHVIVGPSGSGKTTLLNFIAALDYPDDGAVWVGGERVDVLRGDAAARFRAGGIGYASQHSTVVDFLTARENVELALTVRGFGVSEASERATRWLDALGLGSLADRRGGRLSGGEQRRVTLARALAPLPRVLLVDEPTAHLDRVSARSVIRLLRDVVRESGITVVAATHDVDLVGAADERLLLTRPS
jgi:putative ABC transport system ATP-binding protein